MNGWKGETMDKLELFDGNLIHHGKESNRLYLMKLASKFDEKMLSNLEKIAIENGYTKFFAKVSDSKLDTFIGNGFDIEAEIPRMFESEQTGLFMAKYFDEHRKKTEQKWLDAFNNVLYASANRDSIASPTKTNLKVELLKTNDAAEMSTLFHLVFDSYPFPIYDVAYIRETMQNEVIYFGVRMDGELCAVSSAEMNISSQYAEMTDFAILPKARGMGLSKLLLETMEQEVRNYGISCVFTIARLKSLAMNRTFLRLGYTFAGTLHNNTQIAGNIESMNVFYKLLKNG